MKELEAFFQRRESREEKLLKRLQNFIRMANTSFIDTLLLKIEFLHAESMYMCITPTYFITTDGKTPADGKLASKFIIPQKSREFNPNVANNIHTIFSYLSNPEGDGITVPNQDNIEIEFSYV